MYPKPRLISVQAVMLDSLPGNICINIAMMEVAAAALPAPSKNLEGTKIFTHNLKSLAVT